jgi:hypothetical protein
VCLKTFSSIVQTEIYAGRPIRRLVSFFDSARDLVDENDRRLMAELEAMEGEVGGERAPVNTVE